MSEIIDELVSPAPALTSTKPVFDRWQAPDRDSAGTIEFASEPFSKINDKLFALMRMDGANEGQMTLFEEKIGA
jgi:hypothetical protein